MKLSEIYLEAAQRIDDAREDFACIAIRNACGKSAKKASIARETRAMIERRHKPREPVKKDIHWGDHAVLISAIAAFSFYIGYVYGAQVSPAVGTVAAAHADH